MSTPLPPDAQQWPWPARAEDCDAETPSVYMYDGGWTCRCMICARCGHHTGNATQGHWWAFCKVTGQLERHHFCCLGDCELQATA